MQKRIILLFLIFLFILPTSNDAQDIQGAIKRLKEKELITRIIDNYETDPGRPAYLSELILAVDELVRAKILTPDLTSKISKLESDIIQLKKTKTESSREISQDEIEKISQKILAEIMDEINLRFYQMKIKIQKDSADIANLNDKVKVMQDKKSINQNGVLMTVLIMSVMLLFSVR
ncbi:MAG: hypothetical protein ABIK31_03075 [candidate division WOR-3 bacterium]